MSDVFLIGLAAKARSGKDTVADYLRQHYEFKTYAFADPLKKAASEMFGIPLAFFYNDDLKEQVVEEWGFSPRQIAQLLGTEGGRQLFREDLWTKRAEVEYKAYCEQAQYLRIKNYDLTPGFVVTDVRFEDEAAWIRYLGETVIHILRDNASEVSEHVSEAGIEIAEGDHCIKNNSTLEDLYDRVDMTVELICPKK